MHKPEYIAYVNGNGTGILYSNTSLAAVVEYMQNIPGFYLVKRMGRNVGVFTSKGGFQAL